jgi:hypothetical protein
MIKKLWLLLACFFIFSMQTDLQALSIFKAPSHKGSCTIEGSFQKVSQYIHMHIRQEWERKQS